MPTITDAPAAELAAGAARRVDLGDRTVTIERPNGRKASRALALIRALSRAVPTLQTRWAEFRLEYERANVVELDRTQARLTYPPRPVLDEDGQPMVYAAELPDGRPNPHAGELMLIPSPIDRMTEDDWRESNHVLRRPSSPSVEESIVAILDEALELGEEHVYKLLALFTMSNDDVKRYARDGTLGDELGRVVNELLDDAYADELLELAVAVGETVDTHFRRKAGELGDRLGNALRTFGLGPTKVTSTSTTPDQATSNDGPSTMTPTSSTDTPAPTADGDLTPSLTPPTTSSSSSSGDSSRTSSSDEKPTATPATSTSTE